jgi:hypothetical protein
MDTNHATTQKKKKKFENEINNSMNGVLKKQLTKSLVLTSKQNFVSVPSVLHVWFVFGLVLQRQGYCVEIHYRV